MSNSINFVGRLGSDAELKELPNTCILEFDAANNQGFGDKESTIWFKCKVWGKRGEKLQQHLTKGKQVFISGEMTLNTYTNRDGVEKTSPEVNVEQIDFVNGGGQS